MTGESLAVNREVESNKSWPLPATNENELVGMFDWARKQWTEEFDLDEFKTNISEYRSGIMNPDRKEELEAYFKKIRKNGLIFKSAFRFCDKRRVLGEEFGNFIKILGTINDNFSDNSVIKIEEAQDMMNSYSGEISLEQVEMQPINVKDFYNNRVRFIRDQLHIALEKDELTFSEFHKVRKYIRHIMNIYKIRFNIEPENAEFGKVQKILNGISRMLGERHDIMVEQTKGEETGYRERKTVFSEQEKGWVSMVDSCLTDILTRYSQMSI